MIERATRKSNKYDYVYSLDQILGTRNMGMFQIITLKKKRSLLLIAVSEATQKMLGVLQKKQR